MNAVYFGTKMTSIYKDFNPYLIDLSIYCHRMRSSDFHYFLIRVLETVKLSPEIRNQIERRTKDLDTDNPSLKAPEIIDANAFAKSYYMAIGEILKRFRKSVAQTQKVMARCLGVSVDRYAKFESGTASHIPLEAAVRLKVGFKIPDTVQFITGMNEYNEFAKCRAMQQEIENTLMLLMRSMNQNQTAQVVVMARDMAGFSSASNNLKTISRTVRTKPYNRLIQF